MKILVTGGTGFIGSHLIRRLQKNNNELYCIVRNKAMVLSDNSDNINYIEADITDKKSLSGLPVVDEVYHLAGMLGKDLVPEKNYFKLHVEGTKNLIESLNLAKLKRFIYISTPSIAGPNTADYPWTEADPPAPSNKYERSKAATEKYLKSLTLPLTIIRPEFVYGPGDKHLLELFKAIKKRRFFILGSGQAKLQPTYIEDVIDAIVLVASKKEAVGKVYLVSGDEIVSVKDLYKIISDMLGVFQNNIKIPLWLAYSVAWLLDCLAFIIRRPLPLSISKVKFFTSSHTFSNNKIKNELNWQPKYNLNEGFKKTIKWYQKNELL